MASTDEHQHEHERALEAARDSVQYFPRHEPSHWLRTMADAAALRLSALPGHSRPGTSVIVPLVPLWPPTPQPPVHLCARCGRHAEQRMPAGFRTCGLVATSEHAPGVTLKFAFELCDGCAVKEYGR
jgi:hypothetical protein